MKYQKLSLYINGENIETEKYLPVFHKFTGEKIAEISKAERTDVTRAVSSAEDVFKNNPLTPYKRYEILLKASELLTEDRESFEQLLIEEVGKTKKDAIGELDRTISTLLISAEEAKKISGEMVPLEGQENSENKLGFTIRVPKGVIGAKSLALELAPYNVRVNVINPGPAETPMIGKFLKGNPDEIDDAKKSVFIDSVPLGRLIQPDDIASAALYLASDHASIVTGTVLNVDGGRGV